MITPTRLNADIKPENVFIISKTEKADKLEMLEDFEVRVGDFGKTPEQKAKQNTGLILTFCRQFTSDVRERILQF